MNFKDRKINLRWGLRQKRQQRKNRELEREVRLLESEVDSLSEELQRVREALYDLADEVGIYLPTYSGRKFR